MDPDCYRVAVGVYGTFVTNEGVTIEVVQKATPSPSSSTSTQAATPSARRRRRTVKLPRLRESLVYISLLVPAYALAQSFVGGDLSHQAPYGVPAQDFAAAIASPAADATFPIPGYNTSLPAGATKATGNNNTVHGWSLSIGVTANVPLTHSDNTAVNKDLCIDATALSITPPAEVAGYNSTGWRVCAVVFTGGLKAAAAGGGSTRADGSCAAVLPDDCIQQLQANSVAGRAGRRSGGCRDLDIPAECAGHFVGDGGTGFEITPIGNSTTLADRRSLFFAAGFEPAVKGNKTALAAAQRRVWPVMLTWTHFAESGDVQDSAGWMSCAKTSESKGVTSDGGSGMDAEAVVAGMAGWGLVFWGIFAGLMFA
ncbi:hypothetical protein C8A00DRAFT_14371 [Chaetomidium leptoderma]|uniref:Uncharacterized protein n=1 Tax=Chaetomidium leptoderma TaxID=669021 RepID=A0AAN6ZZD3_9PEZI|nr:hypothetical protein C8A00DRAFT_14371 [Chaetomidium leptoderma]